MKNLAAEKYDIYMKASLIRCLSWEHEQAAYKAWKDLKAEIDSGNCEYRNSESFPDYSPACEFWVKID